MPRYPIVMLIAMIAVTAFGVAERYRLYTKPDPEATGGIKGTITTPRTAILQILAMPPDEPRFVYEGKITGKEKNEFIFTGLPMAKYDLLVIYDTRFYEGLRLNREKSTLTKTDVEKVNAIIAKTEPYFPTKRIHRLEGTTGRGNFCRCICTFARNTGSNGVGGRSSWRRTFKLAVLKDVGPGWQVVRTRDLYPIWAKPGTDLPKHNYSKRLSGIRVTDYVKDVGKLDITRN
jgi:hypothetical protein